MPSPPCNSELPMQYCGACYYKNQIHLTVPSKNKYTLHEGYQPKRLTRSQQQQTGQVSIIRLIIAHHDPQITRISEVTKAKLLLHPCLHYCYSSFFFFFLLHKMDYYANGLAAIQFTGSGKPTYLQWQAACSLSSHG